MLFVDSDVKLDSNWVGSILRVSVTPSFIRWICPGTPTEYNIHVDEPTCSKM